MGIQINGQTDTVTSTSAGGSVKVTPLAASTGLNVGTGASISSPATNVLTLGTNNVESVRIDSSGNVGINSTSPRSKLDVGGDLTLGRIDSSIEGGQVSLCRSTDNATAWSMDVYGSTSTPSLRFVDGIAAASRMSIDGSGRVTMPYQPAFSVYPAAGTPIGSGTVIFTGVRFNIGSHYSTTTGYFTAPVAGMYLMILTAQHYGGTATNGYIDIRKNGGDLNARYETFDGAQYTAGGISAIVQMSVGDYIDIFTSGNVFHDDSTNFSGYFLG